MGIELCRCVLEGEGEKRKVQFNAAHRLRTQAGVFNTFWEHASFACSHDTPAKAKVEAEAEATHGADTAETTERKGFSLAALAPFRR